MPDFDDKSPESKKVLCILNARETSSRERIYLHTLHSKFPLKGKVLWHYCHKKSLILGMISNFYMQLNFQINWFDRRLPCAFQVAVFTKYSPSPVWPCTTPSVLKIKGFEATIYITKGTPSFLGSSLLRTSHLSVPTVAKSYNGWHLRSFSGSVWMRTSTPEIFVVICEVSQWSLKVVLGNVCSLRRG